jgi:hypothetical protein
MTGMPTLLQNAEISMVPARTIAEFPKNTFLESIVISPEHQLYVSSHEEGKIYRLSIEGRCEVYAEIMGKPAGLVALPNNDLLLSGWNAAGVPTLWTIAPNGSVQAIAELPEAMFLNGITQLADQLYLIADSYRGAVWKLDMSSHQVDLWLEHPLLARSQPDAVFPAVNGLKIFDRVLYASNTEKQLLIRISLKDSNQPSEPEIFVRDINIDDFAFDTSGNLYGTTHVFNSVVKVSPQGAVTVIAEAQQGMVGTTALVFGQGEHRCHAYVVTNGGMSFPPPTGLETAKVVQLEIGQEGLQL